MIHFKVIFMMPNGRATFDFVSANDEKRAIEKTIEANPGARVIRVEKR